MRLPVERSDPVTAPRDVSGLPEGSVSEWGQYRISLTGPHSHVLTINPGQGRLVIGGAGMGKKADLHVAADEAINWSAFAPFITPAGSPWPRHIDYHGNDTAFFGWSKGRRIEHFCWSPAFAESRSVKADAANIHSLFLRLDTLPGRLHLTLPALYNLGLSGDVSRLAAAGEVPAMLALTPRLGRAGEAPYALPDLGQLHRASSVTLGGKPMGRPISLKGLQAFTGLESLSLWGSFADWESLAGLRALRNLEIRFVPDLADLPPLDTWPHLDRLIAFNIDETAGKRLRAQMKMREKLRAWDDHASVSKLRKPEWWQGEYGRPFSAWNTRMAKAANAAYDAAVTAIATAENATDIKAAIVAFADRFNAMKGIETTEREDLGEAVVQFCALPRAVALGIDEDAALGWFDEVRDY
ncbi:hypothetical protein [Methylobacterium tarhaniae]|uniref:hypothetical protein n=1 Tax=Methylobacterium tarhaniae TaxID=1187852 RepID=UPI003D04219E